MENNIHRETHFEHYISEKIAELKQGGWRISKDDSLFDPSTALVFDDFFEYIKSTAPEKVEKLKKESIYWENNLKLDLVKALEIDGTVQVLRYGFKKAGFSTIECSGHYPDDPRLENTKVLYKNNILRIMHQVHYQTAGNKSIDLVMFINGIPVATVEVKTELTQDVQDAIKEYQDERKPIEPKTGRKNYLLMYKRGAVVHFALSENEIWMCTNLQTEKPKFLPFNRGNNGHKGNPPMQKEDADYPTGYFWNCICQRDNWLRIFHNFVFEETKNKTDVTGRIKPVKVQYFPRYHQWDCVVSCIDKVKEEGPGQKYLIEHSAGSGKTETITWLSHELVQLRNEDGDKIFSSVIIVTDRVNLDSNIKQTIKQLKNTAGLIEMIGDDENGKRVSESSKSKHLAEAIKNKKEIIVVTLQTFPFALDAIAENKSLVGCNFAVLIDEAHQSQSGKDSSKMKAALKFAAEKDKSKFQLDETTDEDRINAYLKMQQEGHVLPNNVSFFAFTATPKTETLTMFGRPGDRIDAKTGQPIPESFNKYPMRQAIEEEYIIDVLQGYMPYQTAYKLKEDIVSDTLVDPRRALKTIAHWASLHPTNIMEKTEFIIEHFVKNVASMLDGEAKAMIVTSSRPSVIRYKYAFDAYLKSHPEYDRKTISENLQFKVPGEPLVAFSDKVSGEKCMMKDDDYLKDNPFAFIKTDYDYTEQNINNLGNQTVESAFDEPKNRFLIVANKFQTGFNQPKLCAMYIDKKMSNDIEIVQTYSRLNRTSLGKDHVYIVDFVNDPEIVVNAFKKYDFGAELTKAQNLNVVYDIKKYLDNADIYTVDDINDYKKAHYQSIVAMGKNKDIARKKLYQAVSVPADRYNCCMEAQKNAANTWQSVLDDAKSKGDKEAEKQALIKLEECNADIGELYEFSKKLKKYCSAYDFISQVIFLDDTELEIFYSFAKLLLHRLGGHSVDEIDIKNLVLTDYKIDPLATKKPNSGNAVLRPMTAGGKARNPKKESLRKIIAKINEIWGDDNPTITGARTLNAIADYVESDEVSLVQIRNSTNSKEAVIEEGRLQSIIQLAAFSLKNNDFEKYAVKIINDPQTWKPVADVIFDLIEKHKRIEIPELTEVIKEDKN